MSSEELDLLDYDWLFWGRDKQLIPKGDWQNWLIMAGRGFGKTRTGAETVRELVMNHGYKRVALVGRTAADVRDVMIEGESGLLRVFPPWERPLYEPSKRRVTFPNGAIATSYSGDKPDQLRGPQHDLVWADELCFVAGTMVMTNRGDVPIESIRPGDLVWTRRGLQRVNHAWGSPPKCPLYRMITTDGRQLIGTSNHPIWVEGKGFVQLQYMHSGDILMVCDYGENTCQKLPRVLSGMVKDGGSIKATTWIGVGVYCIAQFIAPIMARFQKVMTSIISMGTKPTTTLKILKRLLEVNILSAIAQRDGHPKALPLRQLSSGQSTGDNLIAKSAIIAARPTKQPALAQGSVQTIAKLHTEETRKKISPKQIANIAEKSIRYISQICATAQRVVRMQIRGAVQKLALSAGKNSALKIQEHSAALENVGMRSAVKVWRIEALNYQETVYNLEVDEVPEYFANGILVHNCAWRYPESWDQAQFGLRLGDRPRSIVTTTPRPTEIIRQLIKEPGTVVTHGTTYENIGNLAPSAVEYLKRRYEGTRLGQQELMAMLLDDVPGALWTRAILEQNRRAEVPTLRRVVVAIDPAISAGEDSNQTGIVVAGVGADGQGYVLDDVTVSGSPDHWARVAVYAYYNYNADRIVAESNQGGDMVEHTIRMVDANVPVKLVRATKGKYVRAEPVSALYEQGRVHHVGFFAELEDQLCTWVPGDDSPDRLDALVWAMTELMLEPVHALKVISNNFIMKR